MGGLEEEKPDSEEQVGEDLALAQQLEQLLLVRVFVALQYKVGQVHENVYCQKCEGYLIVQSHADEQ